MLLDGGLGILCSSLAGGLAVSSLPLKRSVSCAMLAGLKSSTASKSAPYLSSLSLCIAMICYKCSEDQWSAVCNKALCLSSLMLLLVLTLGQGLDSRFQLAQSDSAPFDCHSLSLAGETTKLQVFVTLFYPVIVMMSIEKLRSRSVYKVCSVNPTYFAVDVSLTLHFELIAYRFTQYLSVFGGLSP
ncbi:hypothetical protein MIR68_010227 [Amoeboaphelidium protococcarum]|nr:hypothetical protein MIR68_010227 [Amoeboaphelidium protococcarum]